jgi:hypothetical protein
MYIARPKTKVEKCECAKTVGEKMGGLSFFWVCLRPLHISSYMRDLYTDAGYKEMTRINLQLFVSKYTHF